MNSAFISVERLTRRFAHESGTGELTVFEDICFSVGEGEFACVVGHSGCGKSTILNILAGLDRATAGHVIAAGKHVEGPSLDRAPWLSALGNVELAVSSRHPDWSRRRVREHAMKFLTIVALDGAAMKKPAQLSGGMKQRVGIARALAIEPRMLLMDEPFSALDALTRGALQDELLAIRKANKQTVFMITHDIDEALLLADKILLMTNGPRAWIAEVVENTLPADRTRVELHKQPNYYALRNHLMDFLVARSRELAAHPELRPKDLRPRIIRPNRAVSGNHADPRYPSALGEPAPRQLAGAPLPAAKVC
jgi:nitrate/nitrite transport system ATP-binding protein